MKKIIALLILFSCLLGSIHAQTWDEWFKQKNTQIKYLTQQMAALQAYEGYLSKGYKIAKGGLHTIGDIKNGEFNLHETFFSSLLHINPSIQHYSRIADIIDLQLSIIRQYKICCKNVSQFRQLNSNETQYINSVFTSLLNDCANDISDLISVTTDGQLQLKDDERLKRIDAIYTNMLDRYSFAQNFNRQVNLLTLNRQKEQSGIASLQSLYHLK